MKHALHSLAVATLAAVAGAAVTGLTCIGAGDDLPGADDRIVTNMTSAHIKGITAITEVFGEGQKVTAVVVEYDKAVSTLKLSTSDFAVAGRTVTSVYANTVPAKASEGVDGKYVVIELSAADANAGTLKRSMGGFNPSGPLPGGPGAGPGRPGGPGGPGMMGGGREVKVAVTQTGSVLTADGDEYPPEAEAIQNDKVINLIVDDFRQLDFKDPRYRKTLMYNLYVPMHYDKKKSYPMVLFMPDASATSTDHIRTLVQGLGAVIWASPSEQAKHECFVLAPQYTTQTVNDNSEASDDLDITVDLVKSVEKRYSIDPDRIYTTGQSGGCMMSIAIDIKYPDLFAASLLVAGQWDASLVAPMAKQNLWIIVSEGDLKAFPGMNAITAALEKRGAKVSRATWSGLWGPSEFAAAVKDMIEQGGNVRYAMLKKGTVVPAGQRDDGGSNHMNTWRIAYSIEGVRDWLFTQSRAKNRQLGRSR
jgi:predicted peptidase